MQRIICVIDSLGSGGAQKQIVEIAKGLKDRGHRVEFLCYHEENFFQSDLDEFGIQVNIIRGNYFQRIIKFRRHIQALNPDAVISFLEGANFICELASFPNKKWKLIVGERSANPKILTSPKLYTYRWFHYLADYIVANSHENIKIIRKVTPYFSKSKFKVIYNIVDSKRWTPLKNYEFKKEGRLNLIVVASHQYHKNASKLIEAVHLLPEREKKQIKIDWYGDEYPDNSYKDAQRLIKQYSLHDIFTFSKATRDIHEKVAQADALGLFSVFEGLPNVVCEGMMAGKPIISSAVSDIPLLLNHNLKCVFNPNEANDIARSLSYLITLSIVDLEKLGKQNHEKGAELFDRNNNLDKYIRLLTD